MRLASIDIGTNSTRFLLAEVDGNSIYTIKTGLITTRLGQGITRGLLGKEAMERTVTAIEEFMREIDTFTPVGIITVATSAVRDAGNQDEFLDLVRNRTGIRVRVLSGEEEAKASYRGVLSGVQVSLDTTLVLDVGGGSTEIIWPDNRGINYLSIPAGAVRMSEGGHSAEEIEHILGPYMQAIQQRGDLLSAVAVGGTATTLAAISIGLLEYQAELVHGYYLSAGEIEKLFSGLQAAGPDGRKKIIGLQPQRADIILAGVTIVKEILKGLCLKGLTVSEADLLHGLVLELAQVVSKQKME